MDIANLLSQRNGTTQAGNGATKGLPLLGEMDGGDAGEKFDRLLTNFLNLTMDGGRVGAAKVTGDGTPQDKAQAVGRERRWGLMGINLLPQTEPAEGPPLTAEVAAFLDELSTLIGQKGTATEAVADAGDVAEEVATGETPDPNKDGPVTVWPGVAAVPAETVSIPRFGLRAPGEVITGDLGVSPSSMTNESDFAAGAMAVQVGSTVPSILSGRPAPVIPVAFPMSGGEQQGAQTGTMMPPMPIIRGLASDSGRPQQAEAAMGEWTGPTVRGQPGAISLPAGMVAVDDAKLSMDVKREAMQAASSLAMIAQANDDTPAIVHLDNKAATVGPVPDHIVQPDIKMAAAATTVDVSNRQTSTVMMMAGAAEGPAMDGLGEPITPVEGGDIGFMSVTSTVVSNAPLSTLSATAVVSPKAERLAMSAENTEANVVSPKLEILKNTEAKTAIPVSAEKQADFSTIMSDSPETASTDDPAASGANKLAALSGHANAAKAPIVPAATAKPVSENAETNIAVEAEDLSASAAADLPEGETNKRMLAPKHIGREAANAEDGAAQIAGQMAAQPQAPRPTPDMVSMVRTPSVADNLLARAVAATSGGSGSELSGDSHPDAALTTGNSSDLAATSGQVLGDAKVQGTDFAQHLRQTAAPNRPGAPPPPPHQIAVQVQRAVQEGQDRLSIQLRPLDLGRIDVQLDFGAEGKLRAKVTADSAQTLELLQKDAKSLERSLLDAGLDVDQGGLSFSLRDPGDQAQRGNDRQQDEGRSGTKTASVQPEDETPASAAYRPVLEPGRVDVRI